MGFTRAHGVLFFVSTIGMFNYIDRGIITGAPKEFGHFVTRSLGVPSSSQSTYIGLMTSAFVACYSVASVIFGHAIHIYPKFKLLCVGLSIWVLALVLSGVAYYLPMAPGTFWFFICARALSGVGEAAFQCIIPPYIEDFAPPASKSLWLAIFYTSIPTGTAVGYLYGATMAETSAGWVRGRPDFGVASYIPCHLVPRSLSAALAPCVLSSTVARPVPPQGAAYLLEAVLMAPFVALSLRLPPAETLVASLDAAKPGTQALWPAGTTPPQPPRSSPEWLTAEEALPHLEPLPPIMPMSAMGSSREAREGFSTSPVPTDSSLTNALVAAESDGEAPTLLGQLRHVLSDPAFDLLVLGYAAFTGTTMGVSSFGPLFMLALGLDQSEVPSLPHLPTGPRDRTMPSPARSGRCVLPLR